MARPEQRRGVQQAAQTDAEATQLVIDLPQDAPPPDSATTAVRQGGTGELSAEQRLLQKVAVRIPEDVVQPSATQDGHPTVLLAFVANGTYGEVTGVDLQRQPITAQGYVIEAQPLRSAVGRTHTAEGWMPEAS